MIFAILLQYVFENIVHVLVLDGQNLFDGEEYILFTLRYVDLDYALCEEEPLAHTERDVLDVKEQYESWEKSNRSSLMLMKPRVKTI